MGTRAEVCGLSEGRIRLRIWHRYHPTGMSYKAAPIFPFDVATGEPATKTTGETLGKTIF